MMSRSVSVCALMLGSLVFLPTCLNPKPVTCNVDADCPNPECGAEVGQIIRQRCTTDLRCEEFNDVCSGGYSCDDGVCLSTCDNNDPCSSAYYCNNESCLTKLPADAPCSNNGMCTSGICHQNVCCDENDTACISACNDNNDCASGLCDRYSQAPAQCAAVSETCFVQSGATDGEGTEAKPFATIGECLETSKPYILVSSGQYEETLQFASDLKRVVIAATLPTRSVYEGALPEVRLSSNDDSPVKISDGEIYLVGLDIRYTGTVDAKPVIESSTDVDSVYFENVIVDGSFGSSTDCILLKITDGELIVKNSLVQFCGQRGLVFDGSGQWSASKVRALSCGTDGIWLGDSSNSVSDRVVKLRDIESANSLGIGIFLYPGVLDVDRIKIHHNVGDGMYFFPPGQGSFSGWIGSALSVHNGGHGMQFVASGAVDVYFSTTSLNGGNEARCVIGSGKLNFYGSIVRRPGSADPLGTYTGCAYFFTDLPVITAGNFNVDPLFSNPDGGDFSLTSGSPCRDEYDPDPALLPGCYSDTCFNLDVSGRTRLLGDAFDLGAYELLSP